ncbi:MAG: Ribosome maturation factor RimP [Alphaproteobacteria bacterium MarineAlpha10_Bin3]|jgi:ribosome maturation factor RimP|nr:MAG: Ribosome maturation factor RimP [Alphaproteobacteria bacterium MarineAlpha10_Bin3]PPR70825.1 MAG: Ribosome maturation factor RimP [Alphaproteobacteria bacterium MarineAlpha4_Bin1]
MDPANRVANLITAPLRDMGFELVRAQISGAQRPTLQIMAEHIDHANMTVEDCAIISRALSALFDVEDAIEGAYTLEVSSPGLDRPLTRAGDYERFAGYEARVELHDPLAGRRRFRGRILGLFGDVVRIDMEGQIFDLPFEEIQRAKLIMNDELLALAEAGRAQH